MTHYAKLAATAFRFVAVCTVLYAVLAILFGVGIAQVAGLSVQTAGVGLVGAIVYIAAGVALYVAAVPLGNYTARGIE